MLEPTMGYRKEKVIVELKLLYIPKDTEIQTDLYGDPSDGYPILGGHCIEGVFSDTEEINFKKEFFIGSERSKTYKVKALKDIYILLGASAAVGQNSDGSYSNGIEADLDNFGLHDTFDSFIKDKEFEEIIRDKIIDIIKNRDSFDINCMNTNSKKEQWFSLSTVWQYCYGYSTGWDSPPEYESEIDFLGFLDFNSISVANNEKENKKENGDEDKSNQVFENRTARLSSKRL